MTALAANAQRPVKIPPGGLKTAVVKLAGYTNHGAAFTAYKGGVMMCDVTAHDGYFAPKDTNAASGDIPGGIAAEMVSIAATDLTDGLKKLTVYRNGVWGFAKGALAITDIGALVYASDDDTVTTTSSNNLLIGRIVDVDTTYAWVDIENHWMVPLT
jgi:predicted RecA/RadA family phage recombinase